MTKTLSKRQPALTFSTATACRPSATTTSATFLQDIPGFGVDGGEIVVLAIKPSMWKPLLESKIWLLACLALAVVLSWLGQPIPGLSMTTTAQVILLAALAPVGVAVARWVPRWHVLTNRRIVDIYGVRSIRIESCPLLQIRNTYLHRSPAERLTGLGTITFAMSDAPVGMPPDSNLRLPTAVCQPPSGGPPFARPPSAKPPSARPPRRWRSVANPDLVHAKIREAIENAIDQHTLMP